jgi:hypothetical protein
MRRNTLNRIVALERSLAPGIDPIDRVVLQVRAVVSDGDLRIYARLEALPESERTQSEQDVFARCEQAYIDAFSVWSTDELTQIAATGDAPTAPRGCLSVAKTLRLRRSQRLDRGVEDADRTEQARAG